MLFSLTALPHILNPFFIFSFTLDFPLAPHLYAVPVPMWLMI